MIILMTLLIAGTSMAFAVHEWWRGHHMIAIGFITFACLMTGVAVETAKNTQRPRFLARSELPHQIVPALRLKE
jgi:glucose uptake protein GlcU